MNWELEFISQMDFKDHVSQTIRYYSDTLKSINLEKFNDNIIDPVKLIFDSKVYRKSYDNVIQDEISRQRDKTNNNSIGYFHQNIFKYINYCSVPDHGFDVIVHMPKKSIYVELKNKHNTMNSSSASDTFRKMVIQANDDKDCYCYLVEVIAKRSGNTIWKKRIDKKSISLERIRRVSIDKFYEEITGDRLAFRKICHALVDIIDEILVENDEFRLNHDTVIEEIQGLNTDTVQALFQLAFGTYLGF